MKALDLFCGAGGAALGMQAAGYDVYGIDRNPRLATIYPGHFICADALRPPVNLSDFHFIWASPPCQAYANTAAAARAKHTDLIPATRALLSGHRYTCIENIPGAPLHVNLKLTAPTFGLTRIYRKRHFELSWDLLWRIEQPPLKRLTPDTFPSGRGITITKRLACHHYYPRKAAGLPGVVPAAEACEAMGIDIPMTPAQVGEAIPPAYARFISQAARRLQ